MTTPPSIVWLTLESTRADHTSLGGHDRDTTPNLRRIAEDPRGRSFSQCFAHGIWTLASSASILTGTYPSHHDTGMESEFVPDELQTVPEAFGELGYRTACLSTNFHVSEATGLDRGFDRFAWLSRDTLLDVAGPRTLLKYARNIRRHSAGFTLDTKKHSTGYVVTDVLKRWVRSLADQPEPFFLYAHYGDPHHPYYPPLPYHDTYLDELEASVAEARAAALRHHDDLHELVAEGLPLTEREWALVQAMYDAEIAYTDALVGELFDHLRSTVDDLILVVTADHGELFGEGGMLAHKVVVDDAVSHVPLVVYGHDGLCQHDGEMVQHADVVQTLLSSQGHPFETGQGVDLGARSRDRCIVQRGGDRAERNLEEFRSLNPEFDADRYHRGLATALRTADYKYVLGADRAELFRLPDETTDVTDAHPAVVSAMHDELTEWLDGPGRPVSMERREGSFSPAMRTQLADLGYLE
jgi:arylsulfatase A-like enzyme